MSYYNSTIQEMPQATKPRERLMSFGEKALSDHELLAILLRTGTKEENVLNLALRLLQAFPHLSDLKTASLSQLQQIKGIGLIKAIELKAAIELGYRIHQHRPLIQGSITSTTAAGKWLVQEMFDLQQEHLVCLFLNSKNEIIKYQTIFMGTVNSSVVHPREIFKEAVKYPTARIIIAHNHPSGDTTPSKADLNFTRRMIECCDLMGIELLDHLIIGKDEYMSLREDGDMFDVFI